jgi:hypothetical protein
MNREKESQIAWENAVQAAKAGGRGLSIWPRDKDRVRLEDLPVLAAGWSAGLHGRAWDIISVDSDKMLRQVVKAGKSYALGLNVPDPNGYWMVVEQ